MLNHLLHHLLHKALAGWTLTCASAAAPTGVGDVRGTSLNRMVEHGRCQASTDTRLSTITRDRTARVGAHCRIDLYARRAPSARWRSAGGASAPSSPALGTGLLKIGTSTSKHRSTGLMEQEADTAGRGAIFGTDGERHPGSYSTLQNTGPSQHARSPVTRSVGRRPNGEGTPGGDASPVPLPLAGDEDDSDDQDGTLDEQDSYGDADVEG